MSQTTKYIRIFFINLALLICMLLLVEGAFRLIIPDSKVVPVFNDQEFQTRGRPFVQASQTRGSVLKPDFSNGEYTINSEGYRGPNFPSDLNKKHIILALGESTTFGWRVKDNETYPYYLEKCFSKDYKDVLVVNGGVPSYSSTQVLITLREILAEGKIKPDLILISILGSDIWYSAIANWHPNMLINKKPLGWILKITKYSRLGYVCIMGLPKSKTRVDIFNENALDEFKNNIDLMIKECKEKNIKVAFIEPSINVDRIPDEGLDIYKAKYTKKFLVKLYEIYSGSVREIAEKYDVPVIDNRLSITHDDKDGFFIPGDMHPNPKGNAAVAEDVYAGIAKAGMLSLFKNQNK